MGSWLVAERGSRAVMKALSPGAKAVLDAHKSGGLLAALLAAAKLEDVEPGFIGPCDASYGSYLMVRSFSERDFNYILAIERNRAQVAAQRKILSIATELNGTTNTIEKV
jgi:hypothetical protein